MKNECAARTADLAALYIHHIINIMLHTSIRALTALSRTQTTHKEDMSQSIPMAREGPEQAHARSQKQ